MLRKSLIAAFCLTFLLCGCGDDEEPPETEQNEPPAVRDPDLEPPAGMMVVSEDPPVFISRTPLTRAEYIEYLTAMNRTVPAHHADAPPSDPLTGLTREQAARVATWHLMRLPSREEWQKADEVVGDTPWPWPEEDVPSTGPIYLVQDWKRGTTGERQARAARRDLEAGAGLRALQNQLEAERELLKEEIERFRTEHVQLWQQVKPAIFAMLDARRDLAAEKARVQGREDLQERLARLVFTKGKAVVKVVDSDASTADQTEAIRKYEELLAEQRKDVAAKIETSVAAAGELQKKSQALTAALEEYGKTVAAALPRVQVVLDQTAEPGDTAAQVQRQLGLVQDTLVALKAREADLPGLPTREELRNTTDRLREQAAQVEVPAEITQKMQKVREMLAGYEQKLQQPFEQEGMLMDEHAKLVDARATRAGLDARVDGLEEIVGDLESEQPAPDTAAE